MSKEKIGYDIILVGASPSNLTLAHRLLDLFKETPERKASIAIIEKAEAFGGHIVSGAVVSKNIFDKVFPNHAEEGLPIEAICEESHFSILGSKRKWDMPSVLTRAVMSDFCKEGYYVLTLSKVVEWMANTLSEKAKSVPNVSLDMFTGFPAVEVLYEGDKVVGVKVDKSGDPLEDNVYAKVTCFSDKGFISKDLIQKFKLETNPQLWSVGVKETWKLKAGGPDMKGKVWHTLGYPTLDSSLGGGFVYGLDNNCLTLGLVISLDSPNPNIHPQKQMQEYKKHPWLQEILDGAELLHYGAAVLPEGGFGALPSKFQVDGALLLGDALGLLDMKALAGVDKAMESGYIAAESVFEALKSGDFSAKSLSSYQEELLHSPFMDKFKQNRYFRKAFLDNPQVLEEYLPKITSSIDKFGCPYTGGLLIGLSNPVKAIKTALSLHGFIQEPNEVNAEITYHEGWKNISADFNQELMRRGLLPERPFAKNTVYSREDAVFYAQTKYADHPHHIDEFSADTCLRCISKYEPKGLDVPCVSDCTAEVHRLDVSPKGIKSHGMSLENCVQCRTCELICPEQNLRVNAAFSGGGPDFRGL